MLEELERRGLARNPLVVILSDHGEHQEEKDGAWACPEVLRVSFILHWPGRVAADRKMPGRARAIDVAPTLLKLLGVPTPGASRAARWPRS